MKRHPKDLRPEGSTSRFPLFPRLIATSLGAGCLPVAPGTWGAIAGVVLWLPLWLWTSPDVTFYVTLGAIIILTVLGTWASGVAERYWGKDPVVACVDETVGQWVAMLPVSPLCPWWEIPLSLLLFRLFDIYKPLGIRATEKLPGGWGMMADDILAGIYSLLIILAINRHIL